MSPLSVSGSAYSVTDLKSILERPGSADAKNAGSVGNFCQRAVSHIPPNSQMAKDIAGIRSFLQSNQDFRSELLHKFQARADTALDNRQIRQAAASALSLHRIAGQLDQVRAIVQTQYQAMGLPADNKSIGPLVNTIMGSLLNQGISDPSQTSQVAVQLSLEQGLPLRPIPDRKANNTGADVRPPGVKAREQTLQRPGLKATRDSMVDSAIAKMFPQSYGQITRAHVGQLQERTLDTYLQPGRWGAMDTELDRAAVEVVGDFQSQAMHSAIEDTVKAVATHHRDLTIDVEGLLAASLKALRDGDSKSFSNGAVPVKSIVSEVLKQAEILRTPPPDDGEVLI